MSVNNDRNKASSALLNVIHQFEKIPIWKQIVRVNPWNIDYLIQKYSLLLLITDINCDACSKAEAVFVGMNAFFYCRMS